MFYYSRLGRGKKWCLVSTFAAAPPVAHATVYDVRAEDTLACQSGFSRATVQTHQTHRLTRYEEHCYSLGTILVWREERNRQWAHSAFNDWKFISLCTSAALNGRFWICGACRFGFDCELIVIASTLRRWREKPKMRFVLFACGLLLVFCRLPTSSAHGQSPIALSIWFVFFSCVQKPKSSGKCTAIQPRLIWLTDCWCRFTFRIHGEHELTDQVFSRRQNCTWLVAILHSMCQPAMWCKHETDNSSGSLHFHALPPDQLLRLIWLANWNCGEAAGGNRLRGNRLRGSGCGESGAGRRLKCEKIRSRSDSEIRAETKEGRFAHLPRQVRTCLDSPVFRNFEKVMQLIFSLFLSSFSLLLLIFLPRSHDFRGKVPVWVDSLEAPRRFFERIPVTLQHFPLLSLLFLSVSRFIFMYRCSEEVFFWTTFGNWMKILLGILESWFSFRPCFICSFFVLWRRVNFELESSAEFLMPLDRFEAVSRHLWTFFEIPTDSSGNSCGDSFKVLPDTHWTHFLHPWIQAPGLHLRFNQRLIQSIPWLQFWPTSSHYWIRVESFTRWANVKSKQFRIRQRNDNQLVSTLSIVSEFSSLIGTSWTAALHSGSVNNE